MYRSTIHYINTESRLDIHVFINRIYWIYVETQRKLMYDLATTRKTIQPVPVMIHLQGTIKEKVYLLIFLTSFRSKFSQKRLWSWGLRYHIGVVCGHIAIINKYYLEAHKFWQKLGWRRKRGEGPPTRVAQLPTEFNPLMEKMTFMLS